MGKSFPCRDFQALLTILNFILTILTPNWMLREKRKRGSSTVLPGWHYTIIQQLHLSCCFCVHFSLLLALLHFLLYSWTEASGYRIFSFVSTDRKGKGIEGSREKNSGERMSEIFLWNIFTLVCWNNQSLVFSGEMKRNRLCSKRFLPLLNSCESMHSCVPK